MQETPDSEEKNELNILEKNFGQNFIFEKTNIEKKKIKGRYNSWRSFFHLNSKSHTISFLVVIASILSIISNAIYIISYLNNESKHSQFARGCDITAFTIYFLEFLIKFISKLGYYFFSWENIFNFLLLISFIIPFCITENMFELAYLSFFRIFQITSYFRKVPYLSQVEIAHRTLLRNLYSTFIMLVLLMIAIFLFSLIAYFCFTTNPDSPLKSLPQSILFLTIEATGGGWTDFQAELDQVFNGARAFSILFITFTYVIIVRGFVAFLADNSIVENRAYIKRIDDEELRIEESYREIRPIEKDINISINIDKDESERSKQELGSTKSIIFSDFQPQTISPKIDECKDLRTDINKFNFWQLVNVDISVEPETENTEPIVYFIQVIVSFDEEIKPEKYSSYDYTYSQIKRMSQGLDEINTNKKEKSADSIFDPSDKSQYEELIKLNKIKKLLKQLLDNYSEKKHEEQGKGNGRDFYFDFVVSSPQVNDIKIESITPPSSDFLTNTTDHKFNIYIRYVRKIQYQGYKIDFTLPPSLGKLNVSLRVKLLGKKRASDIFESEFKSDSDEYGKNLYQISQNDNKITEDKMMIKNQYWASSLLAVLKDYSIHNRMINILYHKIFQRVIMMCDYMPVTNEIRELKRDKKDEDID